MSYAEIRQRVLEKIRPSKKECKQITTAITTFVEELRSALAHKKIRAEVCIGGSTEKGTGLKNSQDIDVFIRFRKENNLPDELERAIKLLPDAYDRVHGSRDYFHIQRGGLQFELVPVLHINSPQRAQNVTDMSPLHVVYTTKKLSSRMKDDVRLAKQFCKVQRVYGAESYLNGFSGHVLELLIIHYGSFQKLIRATSKWGAQEIIDLENHHKNPLKELNVAKTRSPLILVDPVHPDRNAAAALSEKSYAKFIVAAKKFIRRPSLAAFTLKKLTKESLKKKYRSGSLVVLELMGIDGKRDVVGAKCLKAFDYLRKQVAGFTIREYGFEYTHETQSALAYIHVKEKLLPVILEQEGPPTKAKKGVLRFKQKHKGKKIIERNKRLYVQLTRKHRTLRTQILTHKDDSPVTTRVRGVRLA